MLIDGRHVEADAVLRADVCIIGAGPAGLTVAAHLGDSVATLIVESGSTEEDEERQRLATIDFDSPHFTSPESSRRIQFGGMTPTWNTTMADGSPAARYLPLDPIDFETRHWIPASGWPFGIDHLAPYYERARRVCGLDPLDTHASVPASDDPLVLRGADLETRLDELGRASIFTSDALRALRVDRSVTLLTHAAATEVLTAGGAGLAQVRVAGGRRSFVVECRAAVLAAGAIENARLLLASRSQQEAGLGNQHDNVGRYFMDHPRVTFGYGDVPPGGLAALSRYEQHVVDDREYIAKLSLTEDALRRERLLNGNARIIGHSLSARQMGAVRAARRVVESLHHRRALPGTPRMVAQIVRSSPGAIVTVTRAAVEQRSRRPNLQVTGWATRPLGRAPRAVKIDFQPEQAPTRGSRVTLSDRRDDLGRPVAALTWRWSDLDLASLRRSHEIFASELRAMGFGALEPPSTLPIGEGGGAPATAHHHLGTTRMHASPRHGVTDPSGRVHGCPDVYVTGGSVFPTSGYANPTLTIVALAIRLADELRARLGGRVDATLTPPVASPADAATGGRR